MSLKSMLARDTMTISRPSATKDTSGGQVRTPADVVFQDVPVRVETVTSTQVNAFGEREVVTSQLLITEQAGIENGDIATLSDGSVLRLALSFNSNREMGTLGTYYEIIGQQVGLEVQPIPPAQDARVTSTGDTRVTSDGNIRAISA